MSDPMTAFDIAASGMSAQRIQMDVIARNLANASVERADGVPFRAQAAIFEPADEAFPPPGDFAQTLAVATGDFDVSLDPSDAASAGVRFAGLVEQPYQPQYRYDPGNPLAATSGLHAGYVETDAIDPISQMIGLIAAGRAYDADVSALQAVKQMDVQAADIPQL